MSDNGRTAALGMFSHAPAILGLVHLPPLPGSPKWGGDMREARKRAIEDAKALEAGGVDGIIVENLWDAPFTRGRVEPVTVSAMTVCVSEIRQAVRIALGVNVLRNDGISALSIATVTDAQFIRVSNMTYAMVTDQGIIEGCAYEVSRLKLLLRSEVKIFADVMVKHAFPFGDMDIGTVARDTALRGGVDALVVSGKETGLPIEVQDLQAVRNATGGFPIMSGSGVSEKNVDELKQYLDIIAIGTWFKRDGVLENPVDRKRVEWMVERIRTNKGSGRR